MPVPLKGFKKIIVKTTDSDYTSLGPSSSIEIINLTGVKGIIKVLYVAVEGYNGGSGTDLAGMTLKIDGMTIVNDMCADNNTVNHKLQGISPFANVESNGIDYIRVYLKDAYFNNSLYLKLFNTDTVNSTDCWYFVTVLII